MTFNTLLEMLLQRARDGAAGVTTWTFNTLLEMHDPPRLGKRTRSARS